MHFTVGGRQDTKLGRVEVGIRHSPSFGVARCTLSGGEQLKAEGGSMMAHSDGVSLESKMEGGIAKSLKRSVLGGESLFVSTYTAPAEGGWVDVAAKLPGDISVLELDGSSGWVVERGNWIASEASVNVDTRWKGVKMLVGGEGGFMAHLSGSGKVVVGSYGAVEVLSLAEGESVVVDTNHMLAFSDSVSYELKRAVEGRSIQSMKSGEGWVFRFSGPGEVLIQSRSTQQLLDWLNTEIGGRK